MTEQMPVPPWLQAKVDQRLAAAAEKIPRQFLQFTDVVMMQLTEPPEFATPAEIQVWDKTCDGCGEHLPGEIRTGHVTVEHNGTMFEIVFGACPACAGVTT